MVANALGLGAVEAWIGMKLATDAELMLTHFTFKKNTPLVPVSLAEANSLVSALVGGIKDMVSADWTLQNSFVLDGLASFDGVPNTPPTRIETTVVPTLGTRSTVSASPAPQNCAYLIRHVPTFGRSGRSFIPGVAESGVAGYEAASWYGVLAPAATPRPIVQKLNSEIVRIARTPEVRERLVADGADPVGSSAEEFAAYIKRELARWARVIEQARIPRQ